MAVADPVPRRCRPRRAVPLHRSLGLTDGELDAIRDRLGRDPNDLELAMFSVMWSEHCSYKSSRPLLRTLPTTGADVVAGVGEQAGVVSIGDGLAVAFKLESHNHPSAVEPYQGAATGVGGILRDIFSMGARPVAVLDALKFGDPASARGRATWCAASCAASAATATASACRRSAASWSSTRATRRTRWST